VAVVVQSFDRDNLVMTLAAGLTTADVGEIYSEWKVWAADPLNASVPVAFRQSVGGDLLTPGINAGSYFFLQNQDGWRIRPAEEDNTITLTGNLIAEDSTRPVIIPTIGTFRVLVLGIQPITQRVDELLAQQQDSDYRGVVVIDIANGVAGVDFPVGTHASPSNNLTDAISIANRVGGTTFEIIGGLTLDRTFVDTTFVGSTTEAADFIDLNGQSVDGCMFVGVEVRNAGTGTIQCVDSRLSNISGVLGFFRTCGFINSFTLAAGSSVFVDCFSEIAGSGTVSLDMNNVAANVSLRRWTGGMTISNMTIALSNLTVDAMSANIILAASNTDGNIVVRGVGTLTNSTAGSTVIKDGWVDGLDIKLIKALDGGDVTITGTGPYTITVLDPDDGVTVIATYTVSADSLTRTRTA
jgi:hypothetical protein